MHHAAQKNLQENHRRYTHVLRLFGIAEDRFAYFEAVLVKGILDKAETTLPWNVV